MKILKKLFVVVMCVCLSLGLTACGKNETAEIEETNADIYAIYELALAEGETKTYTEWLASIRGKNGQNGLTPFIDETTGHWFIGTVDTGVNAQGPQGEQGIQGPKGDKGEDLTAATITISFKANIPNYFSDFSDVVEELASLSHRQLKKGDWCKLEDFSESIPEIAPYFLGWYLGEGINKTKITDFTSIQSDCTLKGDWDIELIEEQYYTKGLRFRSVRNSNLTDSYTFGILDEIAFDSYEIYAFDLNNSNVNNGSNIVIPNYYNGKPVVGISSNFTSNKINNNTDTIESLELKIYLPNTLLYIGNNGLEFTGDARVYLPTSLRGLGHCAINLGDGDSGHLYIPNGIELVNAGDNAILSKNYYNYTNDDIRLPMIGVSSEVVQLWNNCIPNQFLVFVNMSEEVFEQKVTNPPNDGVNFVKENWTYSTHVHYDTSINDVHIKQIMAKDIGVNSKSVAVSFVYKETIERIYNSLYFNSYMDVYYINMSPWYDIKLNAFSITVRGIEFLIRSEEVVGNNYATRYYDVYCPSGYMVLLDTTGAQIYGDVDVPFVKHGDVLTCNNRSINNIENIIDISLINTVFVRTDLSVMLPINFTKQETSDKAGYDKWVKDSIE